ncbi:hypothetical protein NFIA_005200 [Paecilomyces variotii No. 5]|uniref:BZIP domain-containing protein n=1 Tax=Byssochlamys spectabilis (strain No. 5 / NBRC 109023) TaxID=1356009 RepID=V5G2T9_BYSSN|nr:hypothetical protein NFIA_005200 [Paecilomyces variotii No. 5]
MDATSESQNQSVRDAKGPEEDWTNLSRGESRRKLQNRLNQRASRRRKLEQQRSRGRVSKWIVYVDADQSDRDRHASSEICASAIELKRKIQGRRFCGLEIYEKTEFLQRLQDIVQGSMVKRLLNTELLAPVVQFNIIRAMISNAGHFGLTMELLREDINSPFNIHLPERPGLDLPPSLQPTALQKQVMHHPWIDLCPIPSIRDALLRRIGQYDEDEICHDFFNGSEPSEDCTGLVVWGEAWEPMSYEISVSVLRKWAWIVHDCPDVITSTNYWRALREEEPLQVPTDANIAT